MTVDWKPAVIQSAVNRAAKSSILSSSYKTIKSDNVLLVMRGLTVGYIRGNYGINYSMSVGDSNFKYSTQDYAIFNSGSFLSRTDYDTSFSVRRVDNDLSFSRLLGNSGFYLFAGVKKQNYNYDINRPFSFGVYTSSNTGIPVATFNLLNPTERSSFNSFGPAAGLGFTKLIAENQYLNLSFGLIQLQSTYTSNQLTMNYFSISGGSLFGPLVKFSNYNESVRIEGYTASIGYNLRLGDNTIFQIGYIRQESNFRGYKKSGIAYDPSLFTSSSNTTLLDTLVLYNFGTTNHLKDVYQGIVVAFQYRL